MINLQSTLFSLSLVQKVVHLMEGISHYHRGGWIAPVVNAQHHHTHSISTTLRPLPTMTVLYPHPASPLCDQTAPRICCEYFVDLGFWEFIGSGESFHTSTVCQCLLIRSIASSGSALIFHHGISTPCSLTGRHAERTDDRSRNHTVSHALAAVPRKQSYDGTFVTFNGLDSH